MPSVTPSMTRRAVQVSVGLAAAVLSLGACSSDKSSGSDTSGSASASPSPSPSTSEGVELTEEGTRLDFGQSATVAHRAAGENSILELTVDSATMGSVKDLTGFALDSPYKKRGNYFYTQVSVTNRGTSTVGGFPVPLWGISGEDTLLQPVSFTTNFAPCPTKDLPEKLEPDEKFETCLVFLSPDHGSLKGVSYRPSESFVPIEWHGTVESGKDKSKKDKKDHGKKDKGTSKKGQP